MKVSKLEEIPEIFFYNFLDIDGDLYCAYPGIAKNGKFTLFGEETEYLDDMDKDKTKIAYDRARNTDITEKTTYVFDGESNIQLFNEHCLLNKLNDERMCFIMNERKEKEKQASKLFS